MATTQEGFVNYAAKSKQGDGYGMYMKDVEGWVTLDDSIDGSKIKKGQKVKVSLVKLKSGGYKAKKLKVLAEPQAGGGGGGRGGYGGNRGGGGAKSNNYDYSQSMTRASGLLNLLAEKDLLPIAKSSKAKGSALDQLKALFFDLAIGIQLELTEHTLLNKFKKDVADENEEEEEEEEESEGDEEEEPDDDDDVDWDDD